MEEELEDVNLYYTLPNLVSTIHLSSPPMRKIKNAIVNGGYQVF